MRTTTKRKKRISTTINPAMTTAPKTTMTRKTSSMKKETRTIMITMRRPATMKMKMAKTRRRINDTWTLIIRNELHELLSNYPTFV